MLNDCKEVRRVRRNVFLFFGIIAFILCFCVISIVLCETDHHEYNLLCTDLHAQEHREEMEALGYELRLFTWKKQAMSAE